MLLSGVRVLDLTQYLSGPSSTRMLAALGADVIKVEFGPDGDPARLLPIIQNGRSAYYVQQNRGKRSIGVDLNQPAGHELVAELAGECDVFAENFGPGVLEKRDLDYDSLSARYPGLIYASISAFGREGVLSHLPGYDLMGQALSGMMSITGDEDGPPQFTGSPIADVAAGMMLFGAIGHALFHRERTGRGQRLESTLVDSVFAMHSIAVHGHSVTNGEFTQRRTGTQFGMVIPSGTYRGPDGWVVIQVLDRQWPRFCEAMARKDLTTDPMFSSATSRVENSDALVDLVHDWMATFPDNEALLAHLQEWRVPAAPVLDPTEAIDHPYFRERKMVVDVTDPILGTFAVPGMPAKFSDLPDDTEEPPAPFLGQHNSEVCSEVLGYDADQVNDLVERGVLMAEPLP